MTTDEILEIAPDDASKKAALELASAAKWLRLGAFDSARGEVIWGEFQGSGSAPYRTRVETDNEIFKCSCPSRKRPCKHELAISLLRAQTPAAFGAPAPDWADEENEARDFAPFQIPQPWQPLLGEEAGKPYFQKLQQFVDSERQRATVFPPTGQEFNALAATPPEKVKVFILGQDPYHGPHQAHGLAFSVLPGVPAPPSLENIFRELQNDLGLDKPKSGFLQAWAEQGVLLLNAVMTVRQGEANSHKNQGWEIFTDAVISAVSKSENPVVFVLWGAYAQKKEKLIDSEKHTILKSAHPSPLSAHNGFFGSQPFSRINAILAANGRAKVDWRL